MKTKWVILSILIASIVNLGIMFFGLVYFANHSFFPMNLITYSKPPSPSIDFVGNMISAYSIFIAVVLFVLGVPIALLSFWSWNKNDEFKEKFETRFKSIENDNDKFMDDSKKEIDNFKEKFDLFKNDFNNLRADSKEEFETNIKSVTTIKKDIEKDMEKERNENKAYEDVKKAYDDDPECLTKPEGKKYLSEFSKPFVEKQTREAKRYFFAGISYSQGKVKNINDVKTGQDLYTDDQLKELNIATEYFSMCEKKLPYSDEDEIFRSSLYNENALTLKYLGLYYYYHNSILAMDYLLAALEYFQKAVQSDDRDVLPFNSKSNILKDIYRLITFKENTEIKELLLEKLRHKLVSMSLCVFDIKSMNKFEIPQEEIINFKNFDPFENLGKATKHCQKYKCFECNHLCHNCAILFKYIDSAVLLYMVLLESIICVQNEVLSPESIYKFNRSDINEKSNRKLNEQHKYWCYLTCAISNYLMFTYNSGSIDCLNKDAEGNYWYKSFLDNLSIAIKERTSLGGMTIDRFIYEHIEKDRDLESIKNIQNWKDELRKKVY